MRDSRGQSATTARECVCDSIPIIVGFKGQPVGNIDDLHKRLIASEIGVSSPMMILRGTDKLFLLVTPGELPRRGQKAAR